MEPAELTSREQKRGVSVLQRLEIAKVDYVGLWDVCAEVKRRTDMNGASLKDEVLQLVGRLLASDLQAGNLAPEPLRFLHWLDQDPSTVIDRISREWDVLGHEPGIDDIVWFDVIGRPRPTGTIQFDTVGIVQAGKAKGLFLKVIDDRKETGGFYILTSIAADMTDCFDHWVKDGDALAALFRAEFGNVEWTTETLPPP